MDTVNDELLVPNEGGASVTVYARTASGDTAPIRTLSGAATQLERPNGVVDTANNELMVANFGQIRGEESSVTTYSRTATGNVAPMRRLAGPATKLGRVSGAVVTRIYADRSFNGDGRSDILWRNNVGTLAMWLMNGSAVAGTSVLGTVPLGWTIVGIGDFNGDRKADLLWRDGAGTLALWRMNGFVTLGTNILGAVATAWSVSRIADFNGDGKSDIRGGTRTGTWRSG